LATANGYTSTLILSPTNRTSSIKRILSLILCWSSLITLAGPLDLFLLIAITYEFNPDLTGVIINYEMVLLFSLFLYSLKQ
jgi:hypothetical protein